MNSLTNVTYNLILDNFRFLTLNLKKKKKKNFHLSTIKFIKNKISLRFHKYLLSLRFFKHSYPLNWYWSTYAQNYFSSLPSFKKTTLPHSTYYRSANKMISKSNFFIAGAIKTQGKRTKYKRGRNGLQKRRRKTEDDANWIFTMYPSNLPPFLRAFRNKFDFYFSPVILAPRHR